jgi:hypothetical protein
MMTSYLYHYAQALSDTKIWHHVIAKHQPCRKRTEVSASTQSRRPLQWRARAPATTRTVALLATTPKTHHPGGPPQNLRASTRRRTPTR